MRSLSHLNIVHFKPQAGSLGHLTWLIHCLVAAVAVGQLPVTRLTALSRSGGQIGTEFDLSVTSGTDLEEIDRLQFSNAAIHAELLTDPPHPFAETVRPRYRNFHVKLPSDMPIGRYEVRAQGRFGLSNSRSFLVTSLPNILADSPRENLSQAMELSLNTLLHDRAAAANVRYMRIFLRSGQSIEIHGLAQQIDSQCLLSLELLSANGKRLVHAVGSDQVDPILSYTADQEANYFLAVHDVLYRGGDEYYYQLLAVDSHQNASSGLLASLATKRLVSSLGVIGLDLTSPVAVEETSSKSSTPVQVPNLPYQVSASFDYAGDEDAYDFSATAGETWSIEVISQRIGNNTDSVMRVERVEVNETGVEKISVISEQDDAQAVGNPEISLKTSDSSLLFQVPATGMFRVVVRNLINSVPAAHSNRYILRIAKPEPNFQLIAYPQYPTRDPKQAQPWNIRLLRGDTQTVQVFLLRQEGFTGDVRVHVDGLPPQLTSSPTSIAANRQEVALAIHATDDAADWQGELLIVGESTINGQTVSRTATPATVVFSNPPGRKLIATRLSTQLAATVSTQDTAPLTVTFGDSQIIEMARGGNVTTPVRLTRRSGGDQPCVARPQDLPPNVTAGEITIPADQTEGKLEFKIAAGAVVGDYWPYLQTETKVKFNPNPQGLQRATEYLTKLQMLEKTTEPPVDAAQLAAAKKIAEAWQAETKKVGEPKDFTLQLNCNSVCLRVVDSPFVTSGLEQTITCPPGQSTEITLEIARKFDFKGPIELAIIGGLENAKIEGKPQNVAEGATQGKILFMVTGESVPGNRTVRLKLSYNFNNQPLSIERSLNIIVPPPAP